MTSRQYTLARLAATGACVAALTVPASSVAQPLETAVFDHIEYPGPERDLAFQRVRAAGATAARIGVAWSTIAPPGERKPAGFDPRDHTDPGYRFQLLDQQVVAARRHGLEPILTAFHAPQWAERGKEGLWGGRDPDPEEYGHFAHALATRYSGHVPGLPRVNRWQAWTEPNLYRYLVPQYNTPLSQVPPDSARPLSPGLYRRLLAQFYRSVHRVHADNLVITGGLAPFRLAFQNKHAVAPLRFLRDLLCMTVENKPKPGCEARPRFDVWAQHPYTEGGPNHSAVEDDNVSLGDLPDLRRTLNAAIRAGHVRTTQRRVRLWVTEFSWDTNPPDDAAVPMSVHPRWVAEALYRMWQARVSLVTWFKIRDEAARGTDGMHYESGLYFRCADGSACDRPKRSLTAFRFPFVAFPKPGARIRVWGRTPAGIRGRVMIEQRRKNGTWRPLGAFGTNRFGIFRRRLRSASGLPVRATLTAPSRARSLPFEPRLTQDMPVKPFGKTG